MNISAILLAAGYGKRLGGTTPKAFIRVKGRELYRYSLDTFYSIKNIRKIILTVPSRFTNKQIENLSERLKEYDNLTIIRGGYERVDSVRHAIAELQYNTEFVIVHDCARPLITSKTIRNAIKKAAKFGNCVVGRYLTESLKTYKGNLLIKNLKRDNIFIAETPQILRYSDLVLCLTSYHGDEIGKIITDDCYPLIKSGRKIHYILSDRFNLKITTKSDLNILRKII